MSVDSKKSGHELRNKSKGQKNPTKTKEKAQNKTKHKKPKLSKSGQAYTFVLKPKVLH